MRDEPVWRAIYFLFGDSKLVTLVNISIVNLVLDVVIVQIKNHTLLLLNDYNNLFLDGIQSFIYVLNAWISILLIEHIPETMKRASAFSNPATKSMTSEFASESQSHPYQSTSEGQKTGVISNSYGNKKLQSGVSSGPDSKGNSKVNSKMSSKMSEDDY